MSSVEGRGGGAATPSGKMHGLLGEFKRLYEGRLAKYQGKEPANLEGCQVS